MPRYFIRGVLSPRHSWNDRDSTDLMPILFVCENPDNSRAYADGFHSYEYISYKAYSSDEYIQALYEHWFRAHTRDGVCCLTPRDLCRRFGYVDVIDSGELRDDHHLDELFKQAGIIKRPTRSIREF